jgi:oligopeptide/dipeptide ABC transporter ATP-binding protein
MREQNILEVSRLKTYFSTDQGTLKAVDGVSFEVERSKTVGIVGESGCGKSVTSLSIMRLLHGTRGRITGGTIDYRKKDGQVADLTGLAPDDPGMRAIRGNEISMIFQEPMTSLNPVFSIREQISEELKVHLGLDKGAAIERAIEMLRKVRIPNPEIRINDYPHQLSGGMRQRAMIAMSLACNPQLLIADEPTTALDVTIEAQILRLMRDLQRELSMSIIIISHSMGVIGEMADVINGMYAGKIVEQAGSRRLFTQPRHPYTVGLLESIPRIGHQGRLTAVEGTVPSVYELDRGCYFYSRCKKRLAKCETESPPDITVAEGHKVQCWLYE